MDGDIVDPAAVGRPTGADTRVLLVDDDAVARLLTASALAQRGWQVIEADGGVAALAAFARERPDVVVLDALMPGLDGFATCERLRRLPGGEHVPVLMLTGLDDEESIARAYEAGATDFFVKNTQHWALLSQRLRYLLRAARMREELAASQAEILQLANFDSLTGLPNRRYFRDQVEASLERARGNGMIVAVLFMDIDRFSQINDTLGHDVGDQLLREVAKRLHLAVRASDTVARAVEGGRETAPAAIVPRLGSPERSTAAGVPRPAAAAGGSVARLGGDEFAIVLTDLSDAGFVERVAARLLDTLRQPFACGGQELYVTASIGVAVSPHHGDDVHTLLRKADIAMCAVGDAGGDGWRVFDEAMDATAASRWRLEAALHRALERRELVLHYQPQVDVIGRRIVGAEALMRWKRGDELVAPDAFIGLAEETGLIVPMTEWAIDEVCAQIAAWRQAGVAVPVVSINISARNVQRGELVAVLKRAMQRHGLPAGSIGLELTETVLMHNLVTALPVLQELKQLGLSIAIDDFGTGYSSLAYLRRLPIDTLKIDRSFVGELESDPDDTAIVEAMIALAQSLELVVVAEGVETPGQAKQLLERGCARMQGWLFARALPAEEFVALLREGGRRMAWPDAAARAPDGHGKRSASRTCVRSAVCVIADGADGGCACAAQR